MDNINDSRRDYRSHYGSREMVDVSITPNSGFEAVGNINFGGETVITIPKVVLKHAGGIIYDSCSCNGSCSGCSGQT